METVNLDKGQRVDLTKENPGLTKVTVGLGWDVGNSSNAFDLDAFAVPKGGSIVYFGALTGPGLKHHGDNLTGAGDGDDELIDVDLSAVQKDEIFICVNIYKAGERHQNFGQVKNAFLRIFKTGTTEELLKYDLSEDYSGFTGIVMGKLYKKDGEWKFQAIGEGKNGDINAIAAGL